MEISGIFLGFSGLEKRPKNRNDTFATRRPENTNFSIIYRQPSFLLSCNFQPVVLIYCSFSYCIGYSIGVLSCTLFVSVVHLACQLRTGTHAHILENMEHLQQSLFTQQVAENQSVWMVHTSCSGSCPNRVCHQASNTAPISIVYVYKHAPSINAQNTKLSPSNGIPTHCKNNKTPRANTIGCRLLCRGVPEAKNTTAFVSVCESSARPTDISTSFVARKPRLAPTRTAPPTHPKQEPTHNRQERLIPTHNRQKRLIPTHKRQKRLILTHNTLHSLAFVFRGATEEKTV